MQPTATCAASQFITWQRVLHYCSACSFSSPNSKSVFHLYLLQMCRLRTFCVEVSHTVQWHTLSLCFSVVPALFHLPQHGGSCFRSLVFGSDLITYLFSLSYSKLLWLRVLLRKDIFLPPLLLSAFHPSSLSLCLSLPHPLLTRTLLFYFFLN